LFSNVRFVEIYVVELSRHSKVPEAPFATPLGLYDRSRDLSPCRCRMLGSRSTLLESSELMPIHQVAAIHNCGTEPRRFM
jgi:hypothetical protein